MNPTYNDRMQLPGSAESNLGYSAMADHFSTSALLPEYIYIHSQHDLRNPQSLADMEQMAQRAAQLPNVEAVRGVTRPTGQPIEQTKVSYQAGEVGSKLQDASSQISDKSNDLDSLSGGAHQLASSLATVRDQVNGAEPIDDGDDGDTEPGAESTGRTANDPSTQHHSHLCEQRRRQSGCGEWDRERRASHADRTEQQPAVRRRSGVQ